MPVIIYPPTPYSDGDERDGAEQSSQEQKISDTFRIVTDDNYVDTTATGGLGTHKIWIDQLKGDDPAGWSPEWNLENHEDRIGALESDLETILADSSSDIYVSDIVDNEILARQDDLDAVVSDVAGHETRITNLENEVDDIEGDNWDQPTMNSSTMRYDLDHHGHTFADITGSEGLLTEGDLDALTARVEQVEDDLYGGNSPGHHHYLSDVSGAENLVTRAELTAVKGAGWTPDETVEEAFNVLADHEIDLADHEERISALEAADSTFSDRLDALQDEVDDLEGEDYGNTVQQPSNVTGVDLDWPTSNGSEVGNYNLVFTYVTPGSHTLQWGAGAAQTLNTGSHVYSLPDGAGGYIDADVTIAALPGSTTTDSSLKVRKQNMADAYAKIAALGPSSTASHIRQTHGDSLVAVPVVTANGSNKILSFSNVAANVDGVRAPSAGTLTDTQTLDNTTASAGTLTINQAKIDILSIDINGVKTYTRGEAFPIIYGFEADIPDVPDDAVAFQYVFNPGNRAYLIQADLIAPHLIYDWVAARGRIMDALGLHAEGVSELYGLAIENPRLISGVILSVGRMFVVKQPTNVTGVVLAQLDTSDDHVAHRNTSTPDYYDLVFAIAGSTLSWGGGAAQGVGGGGTFELEDSNGRFIKATVTPGSLPGGNTQDIGLLVGQRTPAGVDTYACSYDATTGLFTFGGGTPVDISGGGTFQVTNSDGKYVEVKVPNTAALPTAGTTTDNVRVYYNNLTDLDFKINELASQIAEGGSGAADGTNLRKWTIGKPYDDGYAILQFLSDSVDKRLYYDQTNDWLDANMPMRFKGKGIAGGGHMYIEKSAGGTFDMWAAYGVTELDGRDHEDSDVSSADSPTVTSGLMRPPVDESFEFYKEYSSAYGSLMEYDFVGKKILPGDFADFQSGGSGASTHGFGVKFYTDSTNLTDNELQIELYKDGDASPFYTSSGHVSDQPGQAKIALISEPNLAGQGFVAGDTFAWVLRLLSKSNNVVRVMRSTIQYLRVAQ